jgi:catechol 2,3-dioxygenase-like lactoylglutathione lyase family enzyme
MINGAHFLLYSQDADADRAFLRDVLKFRAVDAGPGWLIFALPPAELGVHPTEGDIVQRHAEEQPLAAVLYLMCDDLRSVIKAFAAQGVSCAEPNEAGWGLQTSIPLPSGGRIGLYQPRHPTALNLR